MTRPAHLDVTALMRHALAIRSNIGVGYYKGQRGKTGVVGGCELYTGAPYFAAMSSLRSSSDMAYVVCEPAAGQAIKSYSPDLMVNPHLAPKSLDAHVYPWLGRMTSLLVGCGLGLDGSTQLAAGDIVRKAVSQHPDLPLILDGDGVTLYTSKRVTLHDLEPAQHVILTPNAMEFHRLANMGEPTLSPSPGSIVPKAWSKLVDSHQVECFLMSAESERERANGKKLEAVAKSVPGLHTLLKGEVDMVTDPAGLGIRVSTYYRWACQRRCGGLGDILAGVLAGWAGVLTRASDDKIQKMWQDSLSECGEEGDAFLSHATPSPLTTAALIASLTTREACAMAYEKHGDSMLASDVIPFIHTAQEFLATSRGNKRKRGV